MATKARSYWLLKSEPTVYSWARFVEEESARWDGVRNFEARNNLRAMKVGDLCFFYHSNEGKSVVGVARVKTAAYQDPSTKDDWSVVDVEPVVALAEPVSLEALRKDPKLAELALLKKSRLSVSPVSKEHFDRILSLGGTKLPK